MAGKPSPRAARKACSVEALLPQDPIAVWDRVVYVVIGRGKTGKTTVARHIAEGAERNGRKLKIVDLEPVNLGISASHPDAVRIEASDGLVLVEKLVPLFEDIEVSGDSMVIDTAGNDTRMIEAIIEADLVANLSAMGIRLVLVVVCGAEADDRMLLNLLARALDGKPHGIVVAVSMRGLPAHYRADDGKLKEALLSSEALVKLDVLDFVRVPKCDQLEPLDHVRIAYHEAAVDTSPISAANPLTRFHRSMLGKHVARMDAAFAEVVPCRRF